MYWRKSSDESYIWYSQLAADPTFQQAVKDRWANMYPYLKMIEGQIREYGSQLKASWGYNNAMWPTKRSEIRSFKSDFTDWSGDEDLATFDEVINNMGIVLGRKPEELTLAELAESFSPPVTKSCLNHRLRKLTSLAKMVKENEKEEENE
jgi:hypothetical protein